MSVEIFEDLVSLHEEEGGLLPTKEELMEKYNQVDKLLDNWVSGNNGVADKVFQLLDEIRRDVNILDPSKKFSVNWF